MFENTCKIIESEVGKAYPSACIAIGLNKEILLKKSFGNATLNTVFDLASISKIVSTTMIALKFIEQGKIRLYDKISFFYDIENEKKDITLLQLLTHTSGLPAHVYLSEYAKTKNDVQTAILNLPLSYVPASNVEYSCIGYILLGKILEKVGEKPLDVLANELVFKPLNLNATTYRPKGEIAPTETDPSTNKLICGVVHDENARFLEGISGNAGVFSNISDMANFAQMLALGGKTRDGFKYLSKAMFDAAILNRTPGENREFRGLGFNLAHSPSNFMGDLLSANAFGHTGFVGTSLAIDPKSGLFVVLLTNRVCPTRENTRLIRLRSLIHNSIASEVDDLL